MQLRQEDTQKAVTKKGKKKGKKNWSKKGASYSYNISTLK